MSNAVIKKYACNHEELLTDRVSYLVDDIETFLSMSSAASMYVFQWFRFLFSLCLISLEYNRQTRQRVKEEKISYENRRTTTPKRSPRFNWMKILFDVPV